MRKSTRSIGFAAVFTLFMAPVGVAAASTMTVQPGETLWSIAHRYHTTVAVLQKLNPSIHGETIQIGMKLVLPGHLSKPLQRTSASASGSARKKIWVHSGDTLWSIARTYHTTIPHLLALNPKLHQSLTIKLGSALWVPAPQGTIARTTPTIKKKATVSTAASSKTVSSARLSSRNNSFGPAGASADAEDLYWMAHVIHAEANGQTLNAQIAVGDVVWHRMQSQPGASVKDIVFQQSNGHYQFSTVPEGYIYGTPDANSETAAVDVLEKHMDLVPGAYVFYGVHQSNDSWVLQQPVVATMGDFVFAK